VVDDQRGVPTSALSLARYIVAIIENDNISQMSGIYHYTDIGDATWYDFASEIVALAGNECRVVPCSSAERVTRAKRPQYSVLGSERLEFLSGLPKPWREALIEVMEIIKNEL
jgi:dTDP-4-dehydrorhamnose reductase